MLYYKSIFYTEIIPQNSNPIIEKSLYLNSKPAFFYNHPWPPINQEINPNFIEIPAYQRYSLPDLELTGCFGDSIRTTSLIPIEKQPGISIYPNPSSGILHVIDATGTAQYVEIYNANGQKVWSQIIQKGTLEIDLNLSLNKGTYFIKIRSTSKGQSILKKIIIE